VTYGPSGGWRNDQTKDIADGMRSDPVLLMETLDRINQLGAGLSLDELFDQAGREVAGTWYCQEPMPPRSDEVDWRQLGEALAMDLPGRGHELGR
jgi:hypothetical protein